MLGTVPDFYIFFMSFAHWHQLMKASLAKNTERGHPRIGAVCPCDLSANEKGESVDEVARGPSLLIG